MNKLFVALSVSLMFALVGCDSGSSNSPAQPPVPAALQPPNLTPQQYQDLQAQLAAMKQQFNQAYQSCITGLGPQVNAAVTAYQQNPSTLPVMPPAGATGCYDAARQALMTYKTAWNGSYANYPESQAWVMARGQLLLSALGNGQSLPPAVVAALALPTFNQFSSTLNPSLASALGSATSGYFGSAGVATNALGIPVAPGYVNPISTVGNSSALLSALQTGALGAPVNAGLATGIPGITTAIPNSGFSSFALGVTGNNPTNTSTTTSTAPSVLRGVTSDGNHVVHDDAANFDAVW